MFDRVLNIFLKTFRSFVERRIKTVNPLFTFAVEGVINRETMKFFYWQKHPTEVFYKKAVLVLKFRNIHWKAPVVESLSKSSRPAKLLKTPIFKNICQRLLLYRHFFWAPIPVNWYEIRSWYANPGLAPCLCYIQCFLALPS